MCSLIDTFEGAHLTISLPENTRYHRRCDTASCPKPQKRVCYSDLDQVLLQLYPGKLDPSQEDDSVVHIELRVQTCPQIGVSLASPPMAAQLDRLSLFCRIGQPSLMANYPNYDLGFNTIIFQELFVYASPAVCVTTTTKNF